MIKATEALVDNPVPPVKQNSNHGNKLRATLFTFPVAIASILIAKAFFTCRDNIADTDLWWHLRNAQTILAHHHLPVADNYSFTAQGASWIDHSWLSEMAYYSVFRWSGLRGVFILFAAAVTVLSLTVFVMCRKRTGDPLVAGIATVIGGLLAMVGFTPRAQNFGWLCFTALFAILLRFRTERRAPLWIVPLLFCLWINLHPGWPMGIVIFCVVFLSGFIKHDIGLLMSNPWSRADSKKLALTLGVSLTALFVNPLGWRLVTYPLDVLIRQKLNVALGGEWASVDFNDMRGVFVLVALLAVFVATLLPRRRWRVDDAILVAFVLFCGLTHIRFLVMTGIVLPPILVGQFGELSSYDPGRERVWVNALVIVTVAVMMVAGFPSEERLQQDVADLFPKGAVNYLQNYPQQGNMFNQYEWGGFLEWNAPKIRPFIDSRTDIFEYNGVLRDYVAISTFRDTQALLDKYKINYVLYPAHTPLAYLLANSSFWECIYQDNQAVIYRRVAGAHS
jgi:hypothetical protein